MSDFVNNGWSIYISAVVIVGMVACLWLLKVASTRTVMADDNTTGHVWMRTWSNSTIRCHGGG